MLAIKCIRLFVIVISSLICSGSNAFAQGGDVPNELLRWLATSDRYQSYGVHFTYYAIFPGEPLAARQDRIFEQGYVRVDLRNQNYYEKTKYWIIDGTVFQLGHYERVRSHADGFTRSFELDDTPGAIGLGQVSMGGINPTKNLRSVLSWFCHPGSWATRLAKDSLEGKMSPTYWSRSRLRWRTVPIRIGSGTSLTGMMVLRTI